MQRFLRDVNGAVTIDWVALTAGMLLLGVALVYSIFNFGVDPLGQTITAELSGVEVLADVGDAPDFQ